MSTNGRLKSLATRLFKHFVHANLKEDIRAHVACPLWGEFTDVQSILLTKDQWRGKFVHVLTSSCKVNRRLFRKKHGFIQCWFKDISTKYYDNFCIPRPPASMTITPNDNIFGRLLEIYSDVCRLHLLYTGVHNWAYQSNCQRPTCNSSAASKMYCWVESSSDFIWRETIWVTLRNNLTYITAGDCIGWVSNSIMKLTICK